MTKRDSGFELVSKRIVIEDNDSTREGGNCYNDEHTV